MPTPLERQLADQLTEANETIRRLRALIAPKDDEQLWTIPFTRREALILLCLADGRVHNTGHLRDLIDEIYDRTDGSVPKGVAVAIYDIRQKAAGRFEILCLRGRGYFMDAEARARLKQLEINR